MSTIDPDLLKAWLALQHSDRNSPEFHQLFWSFEEVHDLCCKEPDIAWAFILAAWKTDQSQKICQNLSAHPLEELLARHGPYIINRVETEARNDLSFAYLLGGVWQNKMSDEVWSRVQAVWDRRGWDGIPAAQQAVQADVHEKP